MRYFKSIAPGITRIKDLNKKVRFDEVFTLTDDEVQKSNNLKTFIVAGFISEIKKSEASQRISVSSEKVEVKEGPKKDEDLAVIEDANLKAKIDDIKKKAALAGIEVKIKETRKEDYKIDLMQLKSFKTNHPDLFAKSLPLIDQIKLMHDYLEKKMVSDKVEENVADEILRVPSTEKSQDIDSLFEDKDGSEKSFKDLMDEESESKEEEIVEESSLDLEVWAKLNWKKKVKQLKENPKSFSKKDLEWIAKNDSTSVRKVAEQIL